MKKTYDEKMKIAAQVYLERNVQSLKEDDPGKAYRNLKKMAAQPGDCSNEGTFTLLSHIEDNLSSEESSERIAQHFSQISQEYPPLNIDLLPEQVKVKLTKPVTENELPQIFDHEVFKQIEKSKKPRSSVPGDLPRRIVKEFGPELAKPAGKIFRNIIRTGHWPKQWRIEYGTPLQKQENPTNEDQLRIISLTSYWSKVCEQFVISWLLKYVSDKMDWGQYGGVKGSSISHYLIDFVNFILFNQDLKIPHAVIAVMVDFQKAFNRINHNVIITILSEMGVPGWLLNVVIGFLTDRDLIVRYKGFCSSRKSLPGGGPQGTRLGLFLFLILINAAGFPNLEKHLGAKISGNLNRRKPMHTSHMKYVDDLSLLQSINLKENLIPNPDPYPARPLQYHDRTLHLLPASVCQLQTELERLEEYSQTHQMMINNNKCKVMMFNTARIYDGTPKLTLSGMGGDHIDVVEKFKLLGVVIRSDLKWYDNTNYICQKGYARLWMLRRLKGLGADVLEMVDVYEKQVRSVMEMAVPVWQPALTQQESTQIERVQRCAFYIIMGEDYASYAAALSILEIDSLEDRRIKLCENFARKSEKDPKFKNWYCLNNKPQPKPTFKMRSDATKIITKYHPVKTRTDRYRDSPLPYLTDILNRLST